MQYIQRCGGSGLVYKELELGEGLTCKRGVMAGFYGTTIVKIILSLEAESKAI